MTVGSRLWIIVAFNRYRLTKPAKDHESSKRELQAVPKLTKVDEKEGEAYTFDCPGCRMSHVIYVSYSPDHQARRGSNEPRWGFNGDLEKPTFTPSLLVRWDYSKEEHGFVEKNVCHSFIRNGNIEFLTDCTHKLSGKTAPLSEVD